ncbi:MAG: hypothetical protein ACYDAC_10020 [Candidatus Dormibacteria bacterium]
MDQRQKTAQQTIDRWARTQPELIRSAVMTAREILEEIRLAHHDLTVRAGQFAFDTDQQYKVIYDSCVVAANALLHAYGHRASGAGGHRAAVTGVVGLLRTLGHEQAATDAQSVSAVLAVKRHEAAYERLHAVDQEDLDFARAIAGSVVPVMCREAARRLDLELAAAGVAFSDEAS